ncbi:WD40-repeat-containing domain protein [Lentinula lateritia]|nr:WD40-repeat-containing domain protein [Lentinula lateritia]KAJ3893568.1 WD40-repeat-containing domain protein [Lentinula edodes]
MYEHAATLRGARDAVISIAFSVQAKFLAAVGHGGVAIWELQTSEIMPVLPPTPYNHRNPNLVYTACSWLHFEQGDRHCLLLGSQAGEFMFMEWDRTKSTFKLVCKVDAGQHGNQILSIDVWQSEVAIGRLARVVVATADRRINVYSLSSAGDIKEIFSRVFSDFLLISAKFCKSTRDVYAFELNGGGIMRLHDKSGDIVSHQRFGPDPMGTVCLDEQGKFFAVCTGQNFELFRLENIENHMILRGDAPIVRYPKVATFAEDGKVLVGGTDNGRALVFDVMSGSRVQELAYPKGGLVQPVAACTCKDGFLIAMAGSVTESPADLVLYKKKFNEDTACPESDGMATVYPSVPSLSLKHSIIMLFGSLIMFNGIYHLMTACLPWVGSTVAYITEEARQAAQGRYNNAY